MSMLLGQVTWRARFGRSAVFAQVEKFVGVSRHIMFS